MKTPGTLIRIPETLKRRLMHLKADRKIASIQAACVIALYELVEKLERSKS